MKILITSDIHNNLDFFLEISRKYKDCTKINLGDRGIDISILRELDYICVDGNCDQNISVSEQILNIDNKKIFITHGHNYNVKSSMLNLYYKAKSLGVDYVFFGHTHFQTNFVYDNIIFINPGAIKDNHAALIIDDVIKFI